MLGGEDSFVGLDRAIAGDGGGDDLSRAFFQSAYREVARHLIAAGHEVHVVTELQQMLGFALFVLQTSGLAFEKEHVGAFVWSGRKWEEHIHLSGLIRHKFHFFKVLLGDFSHQLAESLPYIHDFSAYPSTNLSEMYYIFNPFPPTFWESIPRKFVFLFHEKLPETVDLKDPLGKRWHVKLKKAEDHIFIEDGWEEFVRDHSLEVGDFLVFRFSGDSCLKVLIFDASGCEKESLYACEKQNKGHACDEIPMRGVGRKDCAAIQLVPFPTRAADFGNVQAAQPQTIDLESDDCPEMVRQVVKEETYSLNDEQEVCHQSR